MRRRPFVVIALGAVASLAILACSGTSPLPPREILSSGSGSVVVLASDAPLCDVVSFRVTVTGATLTPQGGGAGPIATTPVSLISSAEPVTVDFASLMSATGVLTRVDVPTGTYSQATITISDPQLTFLDFSTSPPKPVTIVPTLDSLTFAAAIDPALSVSRDQTGSLEVDLDLLESLELDEDGRITGVVNPVFRLRPGAASPTNGFAGLDDLHGLVLGVNPSAGGSFAGSFTLETLGGQGPTLTVNVTDSTVLDGVADLNSLLPGTFVEVDAFVDAGGDIVAREVDAEELADPGQGRAAFVGVVASVARDAPPNANEFTVFVRESHPDVSLSVPPTINHVVKVSPTTIFGIAADEANRAGRVFDASTLGVGQEVVIHGNFLAATPTTPAIINASSIYLRLQSIVGNFSTLELAGSDGKTGGFTFAPCATLLAGPDFLVLTFAETEFVSVADLNALDPAPTLVARGLLFFEQSPGAVGDLTWTDPTLVFVATRVRQLE
ncbi:MAG: DUF4382 domain-containing protein [Acidobacteria bacterium]|nr:DUF4382 domain-containing protein [Acidobacteriota bacterium]